MNETYARAAAKGQFSTILSKLIPAWKARSDSEHEQAIIRLIAGGIVCAYLAFIITTRSDDPISDFATSIGIAIFIISAIAIVLWLFVDPGVNVPRRVIGCIVDNYGASAALFINGDLAAPIFVIYLWVAFGNGFRFGRRYLLFSMAMSVIGFGLVMTLSDTWIGGSMINTGLFIGLVVLPLYVASLLKRLEMALDQSEVANRAKSNFLATMSHEIRTPLNGLIGLLDLLDMTELKKKQQHYVDLMKNSSEWLLNVISDGLDFTKIEAGELIIEPVAMKIAPTIDKMIHVFDEIARAKGLAFEADVAKDLPYRVLCDQSRLNQIINNLLNNACKFTDKGKIKLVVKAEELSEEVTRVIFIIEDSGIGIAEAQLEEIFLPFKQVETASKRTFGGSGLGLAIVARLVELMGGEISVTSQVGVGTTFTFHLDLPNASGDDVQLEEEPERNLHWLRQPVILLVEDNAINQEVATTYLNHLGCKVVSVSDGSAAIDQFRNHVFDMILMDCQMPKMDGYEATRQIRALENQVQKVTIVALTAHITNQDRQKCFNAGMDDYMGKPYRVSDLSSLLCKWLQPILSMADPPEHKEPPTHANQSLPQGHRTSKHVHDFRNAINGTIGNVELALLHVDQSETCKRYLQKALEASQKATNIAAKFE